ncbi:Inner membrane amino-acid ABC transporter permease protein YecS [Aquimixticola soesokkakensis]|uniref:Inner membrane amino-acid ABC transporter permease protein YecS n=1 Tax=Aquimixticola soesokkakensis TaxID=1519096 RepID=A0A1Y5S196_9RHOB|nr:amino acid ABC transporter permease [Aquimixticola soesokkakensis]SLN27668.1 Inner membrane amino-acid ABC transporter permease protein YecS [Aquimixticola soesokkakensis]
MDLFLQTFFDFDIMRQAWPLLLKGAVMTLELCTIVIALGLMGGLTLALGALSSRRFVRALAISYIDLFRAIPPLVLIVFIYSGLPFAGIRLSPFVAVVIAFMLNNSAYFAEVFRAGILSIPRGQSEAARATGVSARHTMTRIVLPQAVRNVLPDLLSNVVEVVKMTSLASVVSLSELLYSAGMARAATYNSSPLILAAAMYLVVLWPLVRVISRFQRELAVQR